MCLRRFFNPLIFFVVHSDADIECSRTQFWVGSYPYGGYNEDYGIAMIYTNVDKRALGKGEMAVQIT